MIEIQITTPCAFMLGLLFISVLLTVYASGRQTGFWNGVGFYQNNICKCTRKKRRSK